MSYFREFKKYENSFKKKLQRTQQPWRVLEFTNSSPPPPFSFFIFLFYYVAKFDSRSIEGAFWPMSPVAKPCNKLRPTLH